MSIYIFFWSLFMPLLCFFNFWAFNDYFKWDLITLFFQESILAVTCYLSWLKLTMGLALFYYVYFSQKIKSRKCALCLHWQWNDTILSIFIYYLHMVWNISIVFCCFSKMGWIVPFLFWNLSNLPIKSPTHNSTNIQIHNYKLVND